MARRDDWADIFRALGKAFFEVLHSEWNVLSRTWSGSFRHLRVAALYLLLAVFFTAVLLVLLVTAAVQIVGIWFAPWAATLIVAGGVFLVVAVLAGVGRLVYLRRFENPIKTGKVRLEDHLQWWRERLLRGEHVLPEGDGHDESSDEAAGTGPRESE